MRAGRKADSGPDPDSDPGLALTMWRGIVSLGEAVRGVRFTTSLSMILRLFQHEMPVLAAKAAASRLADFFVCRPAC